MCVRACACLCVYERACKESFRHLCGVGWDRDQSGMPLWGINRRYIQIEEVLHCRLLLEKVCVQLELCVFYAEDAGWSEGFFLQLTMWTWLKTNLSIHWSSNASSNVGTVMFNKSKAPDLCVLSAWPCVDKNIPTVYAALWKHIPFVSFWHLFKRIILSVSENIHR